MASKKKAKKPRKHRNMVALAMILSKRSTTIQDRRKKRMSGKNEFRDLEDEVHYENSRDPIEDV